ncbi:Gfo/Idh/MocA family protein [Paenibacillus sp. HJGM_3]|uniref:Gfo/Idh/MocA family protein n=1 Tax=Paenibacillus sp. HJGM_3 TaxID=3379816 RepID=UPI003859A6C5
MNIGVIGYGKRISHVIEALKKEHPEAQIAAVVDIQNDKQRELESSGGRKVPFFETTEAMLAECKLDGVLIGTRCSLHTEMALKVFPSGLPLYLEKPVATTMEDLRRLKAGYEASRSQVVVSFPLRVTSLVQTIKQIVDSGQIGTVEHVQAVNNVPYGNVYYQHWYRDESETGGLFLQKATHDFDYIQYVLGQTPVAICAMKSKQIFKGTKPAGLRCSDCEDNRTCLESPHVKKAPHFHPDWQYCCFAEDTGNEDSGSALIEYESGMHVSYSQNFFARRKAGMRGARFLGYKGTIDFDFMTGILKVLMHHTPKVEIHEFSSGEDHFGGDHELVRNFGDIMAGRASSKSKLEDGLLSALMCLKAKESAETRTFQRITWE